MIVEMEFGTEDVSPEEGGKGAETSDPAARGSRDTGPLVTPGASRDTGTPVTRMGLNKCRALVFHCSNAKVTGACRNVRMRYRQMMADVARYQVDFMPGDANASMYGSVKNQRGYNVALSSLNIMVQSACDFVNRYGSMGWPHVVGYQMTTSNSQATPCQDCKLLCRLAGRAKGP